MALPILDGNQSATTLSSILTSGEHIPAHTVVSLGTQAITDMRGAVSGSVVSISNFPATQTVAGTVTVSNAVELAQALLDQSSSYGSLDVNIGGVGSVTLPISGTVTLGASTSQIGSVTASISNSLTISSLPAISGTVTANAVLISPSYEQINAGIESYIGDYGTLPISGTVTANVPLSDISGGITDYISGADSFVVSPLGGVTFPISGTVTANTFALQGTAVTTSNFTSTTASTVLAGYNATREVLTIFNEGAGNLHICAGATCTTIAYQVRLSAGDYYEVPNHQTTITHSAVFATAGTARVTQVS